MKNNLPNLIIGGVHKSATTSLFAYLSDHPEIYGSLKKEVHFFTPLIYGEPVGFIEEYSQYFKTHFKQKYLLEASPSYLYGGKAIINAMEKALPLNYKILFILRNPAARLISFYTKLHYRGLIDENITFKEFFEKGQIHFYEKKLVDDYIYRGVREGVYIDYLGPWLEHFDSQRLKIIYFEDIKTDELSVLQEVCQWLQIDSGFYSNYNFEVSNKTKAVKSKMIHRFASQINRRLESSLKRNSATKKLLSSLYYALNKSNSKVLVDKETKNEVVEFYKTYNESLGSLLSNYKINLPGWCYDS